MDAAQCYISLSSVRGELPAMQHSPTLQVLNHVYRTVITHIYYPLIAGTILPSCPPPLLPPPTIKLLLPQLDIYRVMASHIHLPNSSRLLTRGALPSSFIHCWKSEAQCQQGYSLGERMKEGVGFRLKLWRRCSWVCCSDRVEKGPGGAAKSFNVWWTVVGLLGGARCDGRDAGGGCSGMPFRFEVQDLNAAPDEQERQLRIR